MKVAPKDLNFKKKKFEKVTEGEEEEEDVEDK